MPPAISAPAQYALRALVHLARRGAGERTTVRSVAEEEDIPYAFLAKLTRQLVQAGLLDSFKGPTGGICLAEPAHKITVFHVLEAIDGEAPFDACFLGLPECSDLAPCPAHEEWKAVKRRLLDRLCSSTIADLAKTAEKRAKSRKSP